LGQPAPAEREVARLVSEVLRNDAIARRLFIAPGTVKVHLSQIFAKLGITHPRRTGRTGSLTGSDRQMIWRVRHALAFAPPHPVAPKMIRRRPEETICMPPPRQPAWQSSRVDSAFGVPASAKELLPRSDCVAGHPAPR
jgi:hypothetical protein